MKNWKDLLFICAFMLVFALVFQSIPPIMGFMVTALGITYTQAGALMSLFGLPGIFISIPGGILADSYGSRVVGLIALVITLLGSLFVALSSHFPLILMGRIVAGIGALTISVLAPQTLAHRFSQKDMGKVMGIFNTIMPLGTILTLNLFGRIAEATSWRIPLLLASGYTLLILILFQVKYENAPGEGHAEDKPKIGESVSSLSKVSLPVWLIGLIWLLYNAGAISFLSFVGDYYVSIGYELSYAGFLSSLLMIGALILSPFVGVLTDRFGSEENFIIFGSLGLALFIGLVPRIGLNPIILGALIGISAACVPAPVFALLPKFLPPRQMGLGYGILATLLNIGVLIGPFFVGYFYDLTASYLPGFNLMAIFLALGAVTAIVLKVVTKDKG